MVILWTVGILLLLVGTIFVIVTENRNPVKTLAWILVLTFVPFFGFLAYFLFGMSNRSRRLITTGKFAELKSHVPENYSKDYLIDKPEHNEKLATTLRNINYSYLLGGNSIQPYTVFDDFFQSMLEDIRKAKHHIHILFFKIEEDPIGDELADLLIQKVKEGVEVRLCYDDIANFMVRRRYYKKMARAGVEVTPFARCYIPFLSRNANYRNHRKIAVVDGKVGYLGGMNIADRYSKGIRGGFWRDTMVRIAGPSVTEIQTAFLIDWQFASGKYVNGPEYYPKNESQGNVQIQVATAGPMDRWDVMKHAFVSIITHARKYVYIQSPYFIPTDSILMAMQTAAMSGVDVRLMIPRRGDKGILPPLASKSYLKEILKAGVKVYFYQDGYLHSKTMVSDDRFATVGSTNIDVRSLEQNYEVNAFIYDNDFAVKMRDIFYEDIKNTKEITWRKWKKRPAIEKIKESFARLFAPLL